MNSLETRRDRSRREEKRLFVTLHEVHGLHHPDTQELRANMFDTQG